MDMIDILIDELRNALYFSADIESKSIAIYSFYLLIIFGDRKQLCIPNTRISYQIHSMSLVSHNILEPMPQEAMGVLPLLYILATLIIALSLLWAIITSCC